MHLIFNTGLIFLSIASIPLGLHAAASPAPTYNNNYNPQIDLHPQIYITNSSAFSIKVGDITLQCIQKIKNTITPKNYQLLKNLLAQALWEYRYSIAAGMILGTYSTTSIVLLADYYHTLQSNTAWGRWKQESNFEQLCSIPQKELTYELLCAINKQYYNKDKPTDFAHPLTTFIATIDVEIKTCKRYIKIAKIIKKMRVIKIFPTNNNKIAEATQLLERTFFIKHLFLSWLAEYNIANNQTIN